MLPIIRKNSFVPSIFDDFFNDDFFGNFNRSAQSTPAVNVTEHNDKFTIEVAAPGLDKKDINIKLEKDVLTISSEKEEKNEEKNSNCMRREFSYTSFSRSFALPENVVADKIKASHTNGILNIEIPKKEEDKVKLSREIRIS